MKVLRLVVDLLQCGAIVALALVLRSVLLRGRR